MQEPGAGIEGPCQTYCREMYAGVSGGLGQVAIGILLRGQGLALMAGIVIAGISAAVNSQLAAILAILGDPLDRSGFLIV